MPENFPEQEKRILQFWQENAIFEKSLEQTKKKKPFVFYDGPPFATGLPHYGHILSSTTKDVFGRYKTMQGFYVRRRWGWDCHGLPIENLVEKELGVSGKKDIEEKIGVAKFNQVCRDKVLTYIHEWKKMVDRIGRWVDFDNSYKTMNSTYMESVWWALKTLWDKGLVYEGKKVLMYCPHCETPVSKAEVSMDNSYRDVTEEAVTVKFPITNSQFPNTYILAWTTTPWTLPGNVALAVGEKIMYVLASVGGEKYILAAELASTVLRGQECKIEKEFLGKELVGLEYEPLYEIPAAKALGKKGWYVVPADFVTTQDGTGIVHTAVMYGEDDYNLGLKLDLPATQLLDSKGVFNKEAPQFIRGKYFKAAEKEIKADLEGRRLLFARAQHTHAYPFCWRCETQLFYNAISAWFINIQKEKKKIIKLNEKINWHPEHLQHGRFLNILEGAPDWNISRNRYWATPLPFFVCQCGHKECVGSFEDLKNRAVNFGAVFGDKDIVTADIHKDSMDKVRLECPSCKSEMARVPEVIDCWMESASMPFAELHYPFEQKAEFKKRLPAQYIAEYIAQTRTWFYYMHVLAILLFGKIAFENVVSTGTILNEKGEKLSKSKKNYTDPWEIINQYGVDPLRFYLMASSVQDGEDLFFQDNEVRDARNKVVNTLLNVAEFYSMYGDKQVMGDFTIEHVLDAWIVSKLNHCVAGVTWQMDNFNTVKSSRLIKDFVEDLSLWYVRRSRGRFKEDSPDRQNASLVLRHVLETFAKIIAPIMPFAAEMVFEKVKGQDSEFSVHLAAWPKADSKTDLDLEADMDRVGEIVALALAQRNAKAIKVRQPLAKLQVKSDKLKGKEALLELIKDEVNVKEIVFNGVLEREVELDVFLTEDLRTEGALRELMRAVQDVRKAKGLKPEDKILLWFWAGQKMSAILDEHKLVLVKDMRAQHVYINESAPEEGSKLMVDGEEVVIVVKHV